MNFVINIKYNNCLIIKETYTWKCVYKMIKLGKYPAYIRSNDYHAVWVYRIPRGDPIHKKYKFRILALDLAGKFILKDHMRWIVNEAVIVVNHLLKEYNL